MSRLTASGRLSLIDQHRNRIAGKLLRHEWFANVPAPVVSGYVELLLVSKELRARIKKEGVMRADGSVHPAVEAFRKYKQTELGYLATIANIRQAEHGQSGDLVADMARAIEAPAAGSDEAPAAATGVDTSASASDEQSAFDFAAPADTEKAKR